MPDKRIEGSCATPRGSAWECALHSPDWCSCPAPQEKSNAEIVRNAQRITARMDFKHSDDCKVHSPTLRPCSCGLETRMRDEIVRLRTQSESERTGWIPMKERQPADFERVLCVNDAGYMTTANRFHDTHLGSWNGSDYTSEEHQELVIGGITHWMPLPEAPR